MGLTHRGWGFHEEVSTLAGTLTDAGYSTHTFGIQHIASDVNNAGYEHVHGLSSDHVLDVAKAFEEALPEMARVDPFFA